LQRCSTVPPALKLTRAAEGELADLIEDFSEGRVQFAFAKVKDPNTGLPKSILVAWCGGGVPERTKGYFTSHLNAVSKVLHGYHVQITARSDADLEPASIMQKVADASGAKYSAGSSGPVSSGPPPPVKSKPVFTPTSSSAARSTNPLVAARSRRDENIDDDGWGNDAPPVTRTQIEKVESAYKPTRVNMAELTQQKPESRLSSAAPARAEPDGDVVRGGYQPIGKVDIAAIRAQARNAGDDRPTPVKGAYEPIGKVDIAAIRAKAQKPTPTETTEEPSPRPLADRTAAFSQPAESERLTSLPKPKVGNKFGGTSNFTGTKAPMPGGLGFGSSPAASAQPAAGTASRTFADEGGKTPAQIWAEKKAKERGTSSTGGAGAAAAQPVVSQKSGSEWKSGYSGKSWATVQPSSYGKLSTDAARSEDGAEAEHDGAEEPASPGGVGALRDRFKNTPPIGGAAPPPAPRGMGEEEEEEEAPAPPPVPATSRPSGGFALPGLPSRPAAADEEEEPEDPSAYEPEPEDRESSPVRVAIPVSRGADPPMETPEELSSPPPLPASQIGVPKESDLPDEEETGDAARRAGAAVAEQSFEPEHIPAPGAEQGGKRAAIQYDYEKAEDNEIDLVEGEFVTNIEMVDEDWWMGTNSKGESGLFPSNYVELTGDGDEAEEPSAPSPPPAPAAPELVPEPEPAPAAGGHEGQTATAIYDYEAGEDNGTLKRAHPPHS
jgi:hypothetical protein